MGSGENGEWTFLDILTILSFLVSIKNLDINITQDDLQRLEAERDRKQSKDLEDIHNHLSVQDTKLNLILSTLEGMKNDSRRSI